MYMRIHHEPPNQTHQQLPNTQVAWILLWAVAAYGWAIDRSPPYIQIGDAVFDPDNCMQDVGAYILLI